MKSRPRLSVLLLCLLIWGIGGPAWAGGTVALPISSCASLAADCGFTAALREDGNLTKDRLHVFVAESPYSILVDGRQMTVSLDSHPRYFDFGGEKPFVNPLTGVADMATFNAWNLGRDGRPVSVLAGTQITNAGVPGRIFKDQGRTVLAYVAGDQPVAGKCRSQLSSYPVPSRRRFLFDLSFQLGERAAGREWRMTPPRESPVVLWQLKAPDVIPSMAIGADTDPDDPGRLLLFFSRKGGSSLDVTKVGKSVSVVPNQPLRLLMDVFLDDREVSAGGSGYWRVWANGTLVVDLVGPTLSALAREPHQWFMALYLYNSPQPLPFSRTVFWGQARMLSVD